MQSHRLRPFYHGLIQTLAQPMYAIIIFFSRPMKTKAKKKSKFKQTTEKTRLDFIIPVKMKHALELYCNKTGQTMTTTIMRAIRELIKYRE
jgi:hypothetical protein